jgi:hypothetical protein
MTENIATIQMVVMLLIGASLFVLATREAFFGLPYVKDGARRALSKAEKEATSVEGEIKATVPRLAEFEARIADLNSKVEALTIRADEQSAMIAETKQVGRRTKSGDVVKITRPRAKDLAGAA